MNIQILINLLFSPIFKPIHWLIKRELNLLKQKALLEAQAQEAEKRRNWETIENQRNRQLEIYKEKEKTKRLEMQLKSKKEIMELHYKKQHPRAIDELSLIRKNKKGRKTK